MHAMRKLLPLLAFLALLFPAACKDGEKETPKAGSTTAPKQVEFDCAKCDKTKMAPAGEAPS